LLEGLHPPLQSPSLAFFKHCCFHETFENRRKIFEAEQLPRTGTECSLYQGCQILSSHQRVYVTPSNTELGFEMPRGFLEEQSQSKGFGLSKRGAAVVATSGSTIGAVNSASQ